MPVTCDTPTLIQNAQCIESCIPAGKQMAVLISLFCQIAGMSCDPAELMANAKCIETCIPNQMQLAVLVYLACQISGGSGAKEIFSGDGDPNGVITPQVTDAIYRQLDSIPVGLIWTWQGTGPWIAPSP